LKPYLILFALTAALIACQGTQTGQSVPYGSAVPLGNPGTALVLPLDNSISAPEVAHRTLPPTTPVYTAFGDSVTADYFTYLGVTTYPQLYVTAGGFSGTLENRAVGGAGIVAYQSCHGGKPLPYLWQQISPMNLHTTLVTIEIGIDEMAIRANDALTPPTCSTDTPAQAAAKMLTELNTAIGQIKTKVPNAKIVLFNDGNIIHFPCRFEDADFNSASPYPPGQLIEESPEPTPGGDEFSQECGTNFGPYYSAMIDSFNSLYSSTGILVVDSACDGTIYSYANHIEDGLHPDQAGQNALESDLAAEVTRPVAPAATCYYHT